MKLQIYLSGIAENLGEVANDHALLRMLARGRVQWTDQGLEAHLCDRFGIEQQQDWPLAALSRLGQGLADHHDYWLLASPVNLLLQRDSFLLNQPVPLTLSSHEHTALLGSLNQHFMSEGLEFLPGAQGHWHLRLKASPKIFTTPASSVAGRDIASWLPSGADAQRWRQVLNEIQMLLFSHDVNLERETRNELAVNSIWLHGGGCLPPAKPVQLCHVYSNDDAVRGMALLSGVAVTPFPGLGEVLVDTHASCVVQASVDEVLAAGGSDVLWRALRARRLQQLELYLGWSGRTLLVTLQPADVWKFWRKPQKLEVYFDGSDHTKTY